MGLRDILLFVLVFGALPFILWRPHIGVLVWSWLSYMNPHRLTYGLAYSFSFAQLVAVTLFFSLLFSKEKKRFPVNSTTVLWLLFLLWMGVTTVFAIHQFGAWVQYEKVVKIQIIALLTVVLMRDRERLHQLIWVIVLSIGFFSTKGGFFTLSTGGAYRVYGPAGSFIGENNSLALATLMVLPLMVYLLKAHRDSPWLRALLLAMITLSTVSVVGSQSRGAFLAIGAVGCFFWLKSSRKLLSAALLVLAGLLLLGFMPDSWHERMASISDYRQDASAMGRINSWQYAINLASDRLTGGGFESWSPSTFAVWAPDPASVHAAHSIFFGVLGDHGWPGLLMFVAILGLTWRTLRRTEKATRASSEDFRLHELSKAMQICMIAYCSGGAFLSLAYFDLPWHIVGIAVIVQRLLEDKQPAEGAAVPHRSMGARMGLRRQDARPQRAATGRSDAEWHR